MTDSTPRTDTAKEYEPPTAIVAGTIRSLTQDKSGAQSDGPKGFPSSFGPPA